MSLRTELDAILKQHPVTDADTPKLKEFVESFSDLIKRHGITNQEIVKQLTEKFPENTQADTKFDRLAQALSQLMQKPQCSSAVLVLEDEVQELIQRIAKTATQIEELTDPERLARYSKKEMEITDPETGEKKKTTGRAMAEAKKQRLEKELAEMTEKAAQHKAALKALLNPERLSSSGTPTNSHSPASSHSPSPDRVSHTSSNDSIDVESQKKLAKLQQQFQQLTLAVQDAQGERNTVLGNLRAVHKVMITNARGLIRILQDNGLTEKYAQLIDKLNKYLKVDVEQNITADHFQSLQQLLTQISTTFGTTLAVANQGNITTVNFAESESTSLYQHSPLTGPIASPSNSSKEGAGTGMSDNTHDQAAAEEIRRLKAALAAAQSENIQLKQAATIAAKQTSSEPEIAVSGTEDKSVLQQQVRQQAEEIQALQERNTALEAQNKGLIAAMNAPKTAGGPPPPAPPPPPPPGRRQGGFIERGKAEKEAAEKARQEEEQKKLEKKARSMGVTVESLQNMGSNVHALNQKINARRAKADCGNIQQAVLQYKERHGSYPDNLNQLVVKAETLKQNADDWEAAFEKLPADPWDEAYQLRIVDGEAEVYSFGPKGQGKAEVEDYIVSSQAQPAIVVSNDNSSPRGSATAAPSTAPMPRRDGSKMPKQKSEAELRASQEQALAREEAALLKKLAALKEKRQGLQQSDGSKLVGVKLKSAKSSGDVRRQSDKKGGATMPSVKSDSHVAAHGSKVGASRLAVPGDSPQHTGENGVTRRTKAGQAQTDRVRRRKQTDSQEVTKDHGATNTSQDTDLLAGIDLPPVEQLLQQSTGQRR